MKKLRRSHGFTIIELMIVLLILAAILGIGVPSLTNLLRGGELKGQLSKFQGAVAFARNQAVQRREEIAICGSANGTTCAGSTDWSSGLIIFRDVDGNGSLTVADCNPAVDCLLRVVDGLAGQSSITATANWMRFDALGHLDGGATGVRVCGGNAAASGDTNHSYTLTLSASGAHRASKGAATCP